MHHATRHAGIMVDLRATDRRMVACRSTLTSGSSWQLTTNQGISVPAPPPAVSSLALVTGSSGLVNSEPDPCGRRGAPYRYQDWSWTTENPERKTSPNHRRRAVHNWWHKNTWCRLRSARAKGAELPHRQIGGRRAKMSGIPGYCGNITSTCRLPGKLAR